MIDIRAIVALLAAALVAAAAYAEPTPKAQAPESATKPAKAAKQTAPPSQNIDIKRDAKEAWSEMRRAPQEIKEGVPAAAREAGKAFQGGWNKAKDGFTGKAPPTIPEPAK